MTTISNVTVALPLTGRITVTSLVRQRAFHWEAKVEYDYGTAQWVESVSFDVMLPDAQGQVGIRVYDTDFPHDRGHVIVVSKDADIPTTIMNYLAHGRW